MTTGTGLKKVYTQGPSKKYTWSKLHQASERSHQHGSCLPFVVIIWRGLTSLPCNMTNFSRFAFNIRSVKKNNRLCAMWLEVFLPLFIKPPSLRYYERA